MHFFDISDDTRPILDIHRWGPSGWLFITACAFTYPQNPSPENKRYMRQFLESTGEVMPCGMCRKHFKVAIQKLGPALEGRMQLLRWVCDTRNEVNRRTGKTLVTFAEMYKECTTGCKKNPFIHCTWRTVSVVLFLLLLSLIVVCYHLKRRRHR